MSAGVQLLHGAGVHGMPFSAVVCYSFSVQGTNPV